MYDWLGDALDDTGCLVTANQRLARLLLDAWAEQQIAAGHPAWRTPEIRPWQGWLGQLVAAAEGQDDIPTRINAAQSQVLWDRCLRKELGDSVAGMPALVRLARDAWQRLADARVGIREVARAVRSDDHRLFAAAAGRYLAVLEHEHWVDDAGLGELALQLIRDGRVPLQRRYAFTGFDRVRPLHVAVHDGLRAQGCEVVVREAHGARCEPLVVEFEQRDAEMRAAAAWARARVDATPGARVAVVVQGLEATAQRDLHLLREGFAPGWQYGPATLRETVNVSYGRRLSDYPAISVALLALRWLVRDLASVEVSMLLLSPLLGRGERAARARLELRLRQLPERAWSPSMVTSALRGRNEASDAGDWLGRIAALSARRRALPQQASPADWVMLIDETLAGIGWPGEATLGSDDFQLVNRWRELLNEFARLEIVSASLSPRAAIAHLEVMAGETVFQPESRRAAVQLMGPLEAAGAEFDALWIAGMTATHWPPAGHPTALVSRALQREHGMPDATPEDTRQWAATTLDRLLASAPEVVCSYATVEDDVDQTASDLLGDVPATVPGEEPGWHARALVSLGAAEQAADAAPPLVDERLYGGAGTVQRQLAEPFSAFAHGRLGVRVLDRQALGVTPLLRGNLVHDTLYRLYQDLPSVQTIRAVPDEELQRRIAAAADGAMRRHLHATDAVLVRLLDLERARIERLVNDFVRLDRERDDFSVAAVEGELEFRRGPLRLKLRFDRIDRYPDGGIAVIDYKTGAARKLLNRDGTVNEVQLFVYAMACQEPVVALALANLDARETGFSGAGRGFTDESGWPEVLAAAAKQIDAACDDLVAGDVRLVARQGATAARPLNLLSRYTELRHDE